MGRGELEGGKELTGNIVLSGSNGPLGMQRETYAHCDVLRCLTFRIAVLC